MTLQPDFTSALLDFGKAIRKQRTAWQWTLERTAHEVLGNQDRKSYVSAVERGKKKLSPLTIQKFATAFDIDDTLVDALMGGAPDQDEAPTKTEQDADTLSHETEALRQKLKLSEALAVALAYEFAEGNPTDIEGALRELRRAFEVAAEQRARNALPSNVDAAVDKVLAEVNALNDAGEVEEAGAALRKALADQAEELARQEAAQLRLIEAGLKQATLERDVAWAASLEIQRWQRENGTFEDLRRVQDQWYERGRDWALSFDLEVSIPLAKHIVTLAETEAHRRIALNNLAISLSTFGDRTSNSARLEEAITAFHIALKFTTREAQPMDWAMTQNNFGNALRTLGERTSDSARLEEAVTAYRNALKVYNRETLPMQWATTQNNLGAALTPLGERASDSARLEEAVTAYRNALEVRTREALPMQWASTQNNLGNALAILGILTSDNAQLEEAVTAYQNALEVYTREAQPMYWATTQSNLGIAFKTLGLRASDSAWLEKAISAYRNALEVRTREALPMQWAITIENLGLVFEAQFDLTGDAGLWQAAEDSVWRAREVWEAGNVSYYIQKSDRILDHLHDKRP